MSALPLISVIVPVYKTEKFLPQCIESILAQTYKNLEIILIDDGSPDNSGAICDKYAAQDKRIRVIHQANAGVSAARNAGLKIAKGEYIGFVDSDDYIASDMYEYLYELITREKADLAMCNLYEQKPDWQPTFHIQTEYQTIQPLALFQLKSWAYTPLKLFRRAPLQDIHFNESASYSEDDLFMLAVLQRAQRIALGQKPCYYYHNREGSASHIFQRSHLKKLEICETLSAFAKEHHLTDLYQAMKQTQLECAGTWLGLLSLEKKPDTESVRILQSYCRRNLWGLLKYKKIKFTKKCFLMVACINFDIASQLAKKLYLRKNS